MIWSLLHFSSESFDELKNVIKLGPTFDLVNLQLDQQQCDSIKAIKLKEWDRQPSYVLQNFNYCNLNPCVIG
jgi:hypothetical protein